MAYTDPQTLTRNLRKALNAIPEEYRDEIFKEAGIQFVSEGLSIDPSKATLEDLRRLRTAALIRGMGKENASIIREFREYEQSEMAKEEMSGLTINIVPCTVGDSIPQWMREQ